VIVKKNHGLVLLIGLTLVVTGCSSGFKVNDDAAVSSTPPSVSASPSPSATPSESPTPAPSGNTTATNLTVDRSSFAWDYPDRYVDLVRSSGYSKFNIYQGDEFPAFQVGALQPNRLWTDAVGPALPEQNLNAVIVNVLTRPDYGYMTCNGLYSTVLSSMDGDVNLFAQNPWLGDCADITKTNDWTAAAMNGTDVQKLDIAKKLALVASLLERITMMGVGDGTTVLNYHLVVNGPGGVTVVTEQYGPDGSIPEYELNPVQYSGKFILLGITYKGHPYGCTFIGFNVGADGKAGDGRFAIVNTCPPPPPPPTHVTTCADTGTCKVVKTCVSVYGDKFPHGTYPVCKDDAGRDPSYNGHNLTGGNGQAPAVTAAPSAAKAGEPAQAYVLPVAPAPAPVPIGSVPVPTPGPVPPNEGGGLQ
jgi:hypothetical protein